MIRKIYKIINKYIVNFINILKQIKD